MAIEQEEQRTSGITQLAPNGGRSIYTPPPGVSIPHAPRRPFAPPRWLLIVLVVGYGVAILALVVAPGGTFIERLRALDGGICAQLPSHSFFPGGQQLPLCSRNTGIYLGFALTFLFLLGSGRIRASKLPGRTVMVVLGLAVLAMAVDGFNSLFLDLHLPHLYQPHNLLRLATGLGTGTAMAAFLVPVANSLLWREDDTRSSFGALRALAWMLPLLVAGWLAVGSQVSWLLYPIAILSSAGLLMALSLVNLTFALGATNVIGYFRSWRQVFPVFTIFIILAVIELMALFYLKQTVLHLLGAPLP